MDAEASERRQPRRGKGATIGARVTMETRAALEAEAQRSGRSLSEVAEAWLNAAREGYASTDGLACSDGLRRMIRFARLLEAQVGDPNESMEAWTALSQGLKVLAWQVLPFGPAEPDADLQMVMRKAELDAARKALGNDLLAGSRSVDEMRNILQALSLADLEHPAHWTTAVLALRRLAQDGPKALRQRAAELADSMEPLTDWLVGRETRWNAAAEKGRALAKMLVRRVRQDAPEV